MRRRVSRKRRYATIPNLRIHISERGSFTPKIEYGFFKAINSTFRSNKTAHSPRAGIYKQNHLENDAFCPYIYDHLTVFQSDENKSRKVWIFHPVRRIKTLGSCTFTWTTYTTQDYILHLTNRVPNTLSSNGCLYLRFFRFVKQILHHTILQRQAE